MLSNKNKLIIIFASVILFSIFPPFGRSPVGRYFLLSTSIEAAPLQLQVKFPCPDFPGAVCPATPEEAAQSPAAYIARLYQFALMLSGMLAFGMIIYGAIQYTVSAGNTTQQSDARDRITQALWGVALLLGAYLILYTIDPKLVSLKDPKMKLLEVEAPKNYKQIQEGKLQKEEKNIKEAQEKFQTLENTERGLQEKLRENEGNEEEYKKIQIELKKTQDQKKQTQFEIDMRERIKTGIKSGGR